MRNENRILKLEKQIEEVKETFNRLMSLGQLDVYEEIDYRMYIDELYEELDSLYN